ncbi:hypothetical protein [Nocardia vaccinii]|uniref:hypothetical protein n=1 Tax=Nocardia vaccinii TaxID=1822 RepID=UPI0012F4E027|nr:hypothetical protein [Nocardia vaccinii]
MFLVVWFRKQEDIAVLRAGFGVSRATSYRYHGEGVTVLAAQAPHRSWIFRPGNRTYNAPLRELRCLGERGFAIPVGRWRAVRHFTGSPEKIGTIVKTALVLTRFQYRRTA